MKVSENAVDIMERMEQYIGSTVEQVNSIKVLVDANQTFIEDSQTDLDAEFSHAALNMSEFHGRYTEVVSAWEREIRQ
jgi:hypothetical protein